MWPLDRHAGVCWHLVLLFSHAPQLVLIMGLLQMVTERTSFSKHLGGELDSMVREYVEFLYRHRTKEYLEVAVGDRHKAD